MTDLKTQKMRRTNSYETTTKIVWVENNLIITIMMSALKKVKMKVLRMEMKTVKMSKTMNLMSTYKRKRARNNSRRAALKKIKMTAGITSKIKITMITKMAGSKKASKMVHSDRSDQQSCMLRNCLRVVNKLARHQSKWESNLRMQWHRWEVLSAVSTF